MTDAQTLDVVVEAVAGATAAVYRWGMRELFGKVPWSWWR